MSAWLKIYATQLKDCTMFFFKNLTEAQRKLAATIGFVVMIVALLAMSGLNDKQAPQDAATGADTSEQVVAANEQAASLDEQAAADKTEATDEQAAADKTEATANAAGEASADASDEASTDAAAAMTQNSEDKAN